MNQKIGKKSWVEPLFSRTLFTCICFFILPVCYGEVVVGPLTNTLNNHIYYVISQQTWSNAQVEAQSLGGNLATIRNTQENNWIIANILVNFNSSGGPNLTAEPLWIGLVDPFMNDGSQHEADFIWISGETNAFRYWESGEPNNNGGGEYWGTINWHYAAGYDNTQGTWNDTPLDGTTGYPGNSTGPYYGLVEIGTDLAPNLDLVINRIGSQSVQVSWPDVPGYMLQQNSNLLTSTWINNTSRVTTIAGTNSIIISPATGNWYFRLSN